MNARRLLLAAPLVGAALAVPAARAAAQLPHTVNALCDGSVMPQTWGDLAGVFNFSNRILTGFGDGSVRTIGLTSAPSGDFGPRCAAYGGAVGEPSLVGEVGIIPDGTSNTILVGEVTFGGRVGAGPHDLDLRLYDGPSCTTLRARRAITIPDGTSNTIQLGETVTGPLCVQWNDPWYSGIASITVTATPEPATAALTALGLGALAGAAARRRARR